MESNFSEKAYRESVARDKARKYSDAGKKYGSTGINWASMSVPVMSGITNDNKVVIRQYGVGSEPIMYRTDSNGVKQPVYEKIGVQTIMDVDPETGALKQSSIMPETIRFKKSIMPKSYDDSDNWRKAGSIMDKFMQDWANLIKDKTNGIPNIDTMPLFNDSSDIRSEYDDIGQLSDIDKSDAGMIVSDMDMKDVADYCSNLIDTINNQNTMRNIIRTFSERTI